MDADSLVARERADAHLIEAVFLYFQDEPGRRCRPSCSSETKRGGWLRTSPSCRSCCAGRTAAGRGPRAAPRSRRAAPAVALAPRKAPVQAFAMIPTAKSVASQEEGFPYVLTEFASASRSLGVP